jgi:hypothetical protein
MSSEVQRRRLPTLELASQSSREQFFSEIYSPTGLRGVSSLGRKRAYFQRDRKRFHTNVIQHAWCISQCITSPTCRHLRLRGFEEAMHSALMKVMRNATSSMQQW